MHLFVIFNKGKVLLNANAGRCASLHAFAMLGKGKVSLNVNTGRCASIHAFAMLNKGIASLNVNAERALICDTHQGEGFVEFECWKMCKHARICDAGGRFR